MNDTENANTATTDAAISDPAINDAEVTDTAAAGTETDTLLDYALRPLSLDRTRGQRNDVLPALEIYVLNSGDATVEITNIILGVPAGDGYADLTTLPLLILPTAPTTWEFDRLGPPSDTRVEFQLRPQLPRRGLAPGEGVTLSLSRIPVTAEGGLAPIQVTERARIEPAPGGPSPGEPPSERHTELEVTKRDAGVRILNFDVRPLQATEPPATVSENGVIIELGDSVELQWQVTGSVRESVVPGRELSAAEENTRALVVNPTTTTTYTLTALGTAGESVSRQLTVTVLAPRILEFFLDNDTIAEGSSALLTWRTFGAEEVTLNPGGLELAPAGTLELDPVVTTTYTLRVRRRAVIQEAERTLTVERRPTILRFDAEPEVVERGTPATLSWQTDGAESLILQPGNRVLEVAGEQPATGEQNVVPAETTRYALEATRDGIVSRKEQVVTVTEGLRIVSFEADASSVELGEEVVLSWEVEGADAVLLLPDSVPVPAEGSRPVVPEETTTYVLVASSNGLEVEAAVTVEVEGVLVIDRFESTLQGVEGSGGTAVEWSICGADSVRLRTQRDFVVPTSGSFTSGVTTADGYELIADRGRVRRVVSPDRQRPGLTRLEVDGGMDGALDGELVPFGVRRLSFSRWLLDADGNFVPGGGSLPQQENPPDGEPLPFSFDPLPPEQLPEDGSVQVRVTATLLGPGAASPAYTSQSLPIVLSGTSS